MTIAEIARLAGVTTRSVRHYHRVGALPEPERRSNGYRDYDLADLTRLLRLRRMVEAGVPLRRIAQDPSVLHRDAGESQVPARAADGLSEVVADLRRQRDDLNERIARLDDLIASARETSPGHDVAEALDAWAATFDAELRPAVSALLRQDADMLALLDATGRSPDMVAGLRDAYTSLLADPGKRALLVDLARAMDALTSDPSPSQVDEAADLMERVIPPDLLAVLEHVDPTDPEVTAWLALVAPPPAAAVFVALTDRHTRRHLRSEEAP